MGNEHVVILENPAKLSIDTGRLRIAREGVAPVFVACTDIAALLIASHGVTLSAETLATLAEAGAVVSGMGRDFLPCYTLLPYGRECFGACRPRQQAALPEPVRRRLWNRIIASKIAGQAAVAETFDPELARRLQMMSRRIAPDAEENGEGIAAKLYWEAYTAKGLLPHGRVKQGAEDLPNVCLNYSYAVLRAAVARSLSAGGFCLSFGLGHCRQDNPFNLAEDLMEVFRCIGEDAVLHALCAMPDEPVLTPALKKRLIGTVLQSEIKLEGRTCRLLPGIETVVHSFGAVLAKKRETMILPHLGPHRGHPTADGMLSCR